MVIIYIKPVTLRCRLSFCLYKFCAITYNNNMVVSLILILALVVFLAVFIGHNISNVCTFWFFKTYTDLPVTILVFIAFASGIVLSLLCVLFYRLRKSDEEKEVQAAKSRVQKAEEKERRLQEKNDKKEAKIAAKEAKASKSKKAKPEDANKTLEMSAADLQNMSK